MTTSPTATCTSCHAPIVWATTDRGRSMPVDAAPVAGGNVRLIMRRFPLPPLAKVVGSAIDLFDDTDVGDRHTSHFVTCPNAAEHRKPR